MKCLLITALIFSVSSWAQDSNLHKTSMSQSSSESWKTLTCSGFKTWQDCRTQAKASCPNGYVTADALENILIQRREVSIACKG